MHFLGRASTVHRKALEVMRKECGYTETNIPQLEEVSNFLKSMFEDLFFNFMFNL